MGVGGWVYSRIHTFDWLVSFCCLIDANGRREEGPVLTMVSSSIPQFFSFPEAV